jgi:hemoglobin
MQSVYEAAGGSEGLLRLAGAWHSRVMADEIVSHAFSHGFHPQHNERLAAYWAEALGGPTTFSDAYGDETSVVRIHSGNGPHEEMDRRAIACFDQAMQDVGLEADEPLRQVLHDYFAWATTTTMSRYHESADDVPEGLRIPRWSWDGLQRRTSTLRPAASPETWLWSTSRVAVSRVIWPWRATSLSLPSAALRSGSTNSAA